MERDPVCGMEVSRQKAASVFQYNGRTYYFCAEACKQAFERNPEKYLRQDKDEK